MSHTQNQITASASPSVGTLLRMVRRLVRSSRGAAAIEFALIAPIIVVVVTGIGSYGALAFEKMQLNSAAHAGAQLALIDSSDETAIATAVVQSTTLPITTADVTVTTFCECADGSTITCGNTCSDASSTRKFMSVAVTMTSSLLFNMGDTTLDQTATVRIN